jgi:hypothetical protein
MNLSHVPVSFRGDLMMCRLRFAFQASDHPFDLNAQQINERIKHRIVGELLYLSGESLISSTTLNKSVHQS